MAISRGGIAAFFVILDIDFSVQRSRIFVLYTPNSKKGNFFTETILTNTTGDISNILDGISVLR
uniref:Uncharacterized protein n=1 Tax=Lepeophtheirus salmonis TaxID=72036 RepID=A0A0K2TBC9_LEPSM